MPDILIKPLGEHEEACVALLEHVLTDARNGNVTSIGLVICSKNGFRATAAGAQLGDMHLGAASLQHQILELVEGQGAAAARSSRIVRARPAG